MKELEPKDLVITARQTCRILDSVCWDFRITTTLYALEVMRPSTPRSPDSLMWLACLHLGSPRDP